MNDVAKLFEERTRTARKAYVCCECGREIAIGSRHRCSSGLWDCWRHYRSCLRCSNVRRLALIRYGPCSPDEGPAFGFLREWIREAMGGG